jgi:hypothetical protein
MLLSYVVVNLLLTNEGVQRVAVGIAGPRSLYLGNGRVIIWPGGVRTMPTDANIAEAQRFNTAWLLVGASAAALVVMGGFVVLVRRKHLHLQAILLMLLTEVGLLVLSVCMGIANLATDAIVFDSLLRGELRVSSEIYAAAYATIFCFGVVATALSLGYRIRNARLVNVALQQLSPQHPGRTASEAHRQLQQCEWELVQTHRTKVTLSLSLVSVVAQGTLDPGRGTP